MTETTDNRIIKGPGNTEFEIVGADEAAEIEEVAYLTSTGCPRFDFQRGACRHSDGLIFHIGCNEDPAKLKQLFGGRIFNCDDRDYDETLRRRLPVDKVFDWRGTWPFANDSGELVVFNDCLQLPLNQMVSVLRESNRVARRVAITVPQDLRSPYPVTLAVIRRALSLAFFTPFVLMGADWGYGDGTEGWLVEAYRNC